MTIDKRTKNNHYMLAKKDNIILYGAATMGTLYFRSLSALGYSIVGFFDKRADEIGWHCGLPVYDSQKYHLDKDKIIVLLAVKNVFEHSRIVKNLLKQGYSKIIYRPYAALDGSGTREECELNNIYSKLTEGGRIEDDIPVPFPDEDAKMDFSAQGILRDGFMVTAYVPVTIIFTDNREGMPQIPILFLKPHINFVKYLLGIHGGEKESYLEYCIKAANRVGNVKITQKWKENVLANRSEVFGNMNHMYNIKPSFFIDKAVDVDWNPERNYFNLKSGKHRAAFLTAVGRNYIPVMMSRKDYSLYLENMDIYTVKEIIPGYYDRGLSIPIENPYFYEYSCCGELFWFGFLRAVMDIFNSVFYRENGSFVLENIHIVIELPDYGFTRRFFQRMGCKVISGEKKLCSLEKAIESCFAHYDAMEMKYNEDMHYECIICTDEWLGTHMVDSDYIFVLSENNECREGEKIMSGLCDGKEKFLYLISNKTSRYARMEMPDHKGNIKKT